MAADQQFYQILNSLLSYNNEERTAAEVSEQIVNFDKFPLHKSFESFVV